MTKLAVAVGAKDHRQGNNDAPCTLVEYGDYQCPSCGQAYPIVKRVQRHFGKRLSFVFRNFPLTQLHPYAEAAAETAEFAGAHEKFWEMHDLLFENQDRLDDELLVELAQALHLVPAQLLKALETKEFQPRVRADFTAGVRSGVNGTPTFFINGQRHDGSYDFASLVEAIDAVLE
jgi:protein-disulfide isomerase